MIRRAVLLSLAALLVVPAGAFAQMTYRLRGSVRDSDNKPIAGATIRAEALIGFRGEQFVGAREFAATSNDKGEWVILGLTSGIWVFEATASGTIPQVVALPISFSNRKPQSAQGGSFPWDLPLWVRRTANAGLTRAAEAAVAKRTDDAVAAIGPLAVDPDSDVLCAAGELALLVRQNGLSHAIFQEVLKRDPKHACATIGMASTALLQSNLDLASKMLWAAIDLAPREQRPALGAAVKDLAQITGTK